MEDDNWDLFAVVRGCSSIFTTTSSSSPITNSTAMATTAYPPSSSLFRTQGQQQQQQQQEERLLCFPDLYEPRSESNFEELLHDLCKPLVQQSQPLSPHNLSVSPVSVLGGLPDLCQKQQQQQQQQQHQLQQQQLQQQNQRFLGSRASGIPTSVSTTSSRNPASGPRYKRRKNQMKRVCHVPAEGLSSDMWSWRKYGQKPIKGSPHPRGYYRCSTSKSCMARKQVERNRSDSGMFIVTYTAEHNHPMPTHRNSLAGSTRQKPVASPTEAAGDTTDKPSCSSPTSPGASQSPATEKVASREDTEDVADEEDDNNGVSDLAMDDDFFEGLDDLAGTDVGASLLDDLPVGLTFPWLTKNATTPHPTVVDSTRF